MARIGWSQVFHYAQDAAKLEKIACRFPEQAANSIICISWEPRRLETILRSDEVDQSPWQPPEYPDLMQSSDWRGWWQAPLTFHVVPSSMTIVIKTSQIILSSFKNISSRRRKQKWVVRDLKRTFRPIFEIQEWQFSLDDGRNYTVLLLRNNDRGH